MNKLEIIGNLGGDPEKRFTPAGQAVTSFNVATTRKYKNADGGQVNETTWFRVSCWGNLAEITEQYLKKGSKVFVEGRLASIIRVYESNGEHKASYELTAEKVEFLSTKPAEETPF